MAPAPKSICAALPGSRVRARQPRRSISTKPASIPARQSRRSSTSARSKCCAGRRAHRAARLRFRALSRSPPRSRTSPSLAALRRASMPRPIIGMCRRRSMCRWSRMCWPFVSPPISRTAKAPASIALAARSSPSRTTARSAALCCSSQPIRCRSRRCTSGVRQMSFATIRWLAAAAPGLRQQLWLRLADWAPSRPISTDRL